jgi:hypothetical protein
MSDRRILYRTPTDAWISDTAGRTTRVRRWCMAQWIGLGLLLLTVWGILIGLVLLAVRQTVPH